MHLPNPHTTSFQSRNEEENKYGGAIYANYHSNISIFSFSGMPELIDEAMMLVLAKRLAIDASRSLIQKIEGYQRNPYWELIDTNFFSQLFLKEHGRK